MLYKILRFFINIWIRLWYRFRVENLPSPLPEGRLILCANHASMVDPLAIACAWPKPLSFIAKKELSKSRILGYLGRHAGVIFIDRQANDIDSIRKALGVLNDDKYLCLFPEGTRVKTVDPANIKEGTGLLAMRGKSDILPISIISEYKFRRTLTVRFHDIMETDKYKALGAAKGRKALSEDLFYAMYGLEKPKAIEEEHASTNQ